MNTARSNLSNFTKTVILFMFGGLVYCLIEFVWRSLGDGSSVHPTMFLLGGSAFILIGRINEDIEWEMPFRLQVSLGTVMVLILEFVYGCVLNLWLGLDIWDYSELKFNILGQVCPQYTIAWVFVVAFAIVVDDYFRYFVYGEEKPHYKF